MGGAECNADIAGHAAAEVIVLATPWPAVPDALRSAGHSVVLHAGGGSFKSQMKKADKLGARFVAIRGEDERAKDVWMVRDMGSSSQEEVKAGDVAGHLEGKLRG